MVTIKRASKAGETYKSRFGTIPLAEVGVHARPMPDQYIAPGGMDVTKSFLSYVRPLVGALPEYPGLTIKRAKV